MAWLHAVPESADRKISDKPGSPEAERAKKSRLERLTAEGKVAELPEIRSSHLVGYLWDAGPTIPGAMGNAPLSHGEINAWMQNTDIKLQPWQVRVLRRLSAEYVSESQRATKPNCPPPYRADLRERRADVAKKIDEMFG